MTDWSPPSSVYEFLPRSSSLSRSVDDQPQNLDGRVAVKIQEYVPYESTLQGRRFLRVLFFSFLFSFLLSSFVFVKRMESVCQPLPFAPPISPFSFSFSFSCLTHDNFILTNPSGLARCTCLRQRPHSRHLWLGCPA